MGEASEQLENSLVFFVNGRKCIEQKPKPDQFLISYLRRNLQLRGTKLACGEGGCGACTVMISKYDPTEDVVRHFSVNACLMPLCAVHGLAVTTVEGIGNLNNIHPVQERIAKFHGSQCGFCTPGFVMSMYTLLRNNNSPTNQDIGHAFDGNLCRCTGYRGIMDGFKTFSKEFVCGMGEDCCQNKSKTTKGTNGKDTNDKVQATENHLGPAVSDLKALNTKQEPIFPPELKVKHKKYHRQFVKWTHQNQTWFRPESLNEIVDLRHAYPKARIVNGNTELGIDIRLKNTEYPVLIFPSSIAELQDFKLTPNGVVIGSCITLESLNKNLKAVIFSQPEYKTRDFSAIVEMLRWFAGQQIRNVATLAGNIMTASPISDLIPLLIAAGATLTFVSKGCKERQVKLSQSFFTGYRQTDTKSEELLLSVTIPFTEQNEYFMGYKQANRKDDDIAMVNCGMKVAISPDGTVHSARLVYGGMAATVVEAAYTCKYLTGKKWDDDILPKAYEALINDFPLAPGSPGGFAEYRKSLAVGFFFKFFLHVKQQQNSENIAVESLEPKFGESTQLYNARRWGCNVNSVGMPMYHLSALQQSTGEALYIDDIIPAQNEVYLALVYSTKSHARLNKVDPTVALSMPGVVDYICAADIPGPNDMETISDEIFVTQTVTAQGQIIGAIVAESREVARQAASKVEIDYQELPAIVTIKEAIEQKSLFDFELKQVWGDTELAMKSCENILDGEFNMNGQCHFYMETQSTRAVPGENGEMEIFSSNQAPSMLQSYAAKALNVPSSKIVVRTKRLGGGFGGKETQTVLSALPTAIAAKKLGRPVRCILDWDTDMITTGNRHPFYSKYKVGFNKQGDITALDMKLYANGGNSLDLTFPVVKKAVISIHSCYGIPNINVAGYGCRTNILSNTAFRGFGGPQGHMMIETVLDDVAAFLDLDPAEVRVRNFWKPGENNYMDISPGGAALRNTWEICQHSSQFKERQKSIENFNKKSKLQKKGISINPVKFGVAFCQYQLNQAGALVHIYLDGSVLVTHGGVEMGQGLHVKIAQIASQVLNLPMDQIQITETGTNTVPNSAPTAASVSTDLNGLAVKKACETLMERLKPFIDENKKGTWVEWVNAAYESKVSLSATGYHGTPNLNYDLKTQQGRPFNYFSFGAACSEVLIDCLTGEHKVLRADLVLDVGQSINPAIDVGQIEGAFMQGYGLVMLEEMKISPDGVLLTRGPGTYKIPSMGNVPEQFNVSLVPDSYNPEAIFSSKAVGEPPLLFGAAVYFAVKDAIRAYRRGAGENLVFKLNSPAVPPRIRMACPDNITKKFPEAKEGSYKPWFVDL